MTRSVFVSLLFAALAGAQVDKSPAPAAATPALQATPQGASSAADTVVYSPAQPLEHGPDNHGHALRGTVDSINPITVTELARMGIDSARKLYLGKTVTFRDLSPVGVSAKNERRKNVCMQGFVKRFYPTWMGKLQDAAVGVFFNYGDEITEWLNHTPYKPEDLVVETPLILEEDVCDTARVCNDGYESLGRRCIFASDRFLIAGKIISINVEERGRSFNVYLRPTGLRY